MMARQGFKVIAYLDDFLIVEKNKGQCALALKTLITLLQSLGLAIAWEKVEGPTTTLTFLGIVLNLVKMTMHISQNKVNDIKHHLEQFKT